MFEHLCSPVYQMKFGRMCKVAIGFETEDVVPIDHMTLVHSVEPSRPNTFSSSV